MSNDDDDTKLIRTLAPQEFAAQSINLQFCWRVDLGKELEDQIWQHVLSALSDIALPNNPSVAVVGRPGLSTINDTIHVDIFDDFGRRACSLAIEERGAGATRVMWYESQEPRNRLEAPRFGRVFFRRFLLDGTVVGL